MAEFDQYAKNYEGGMENRFKQSMGESLKQFLLVKYRILEKIIKKHLPEAKSYLDFGCGAGDFLNIAKEQNTKLRLTGYDLSKEMLVEAREKHCSLEEIELHSDLDQLRNKNFSLSTAICVFHHIPPEEWQDTINNIFELLEPGGMFFIFEHNPWNPATQYIVKNTPIDENAILLSSIQTKRLFRHAGFKEIKTEFFLFFPPKWTKLSKFDPVFKWLPLGGQYVVCGKKI